MKLGKIKRLFFILFFFTIYSSFVYPEEKIKSVPLINLEELSPTFEEDKDELEKIQEKTTTPEETETLKTSTSQENEKVYINLTALDKITAKTSSIKLAVGEKKFFGPLEIKALKCKLSNNNNTNDTVAYLQVRDLSNKDNNQVFLFNGWTFTSSPALKPMDHPVYDLWVTSCENINRSFLLITNLHQSLNL